MGSSETAGPGRAADTFSIAGTRRCLRPDACPHAAPQPGLTGNPRTWESALLSLLPGDPDLARELLAALVRPDLAALS